mmetsp:Transcript_77462/g.205641  ORF Transcript_77462/g.205641 Transcript_77462/m.205641 type:complete len:327 (+) Transcript_77462:453-1433(+)
MPIMNWHCRLPWAAILPWRPAWPQPAPPLALLLCEPAWCHCPREPAAACRAAPPWAQAVTARPSPRCSLTAAAAASPRLPAAEAVGAGACAGWSVLPRTMVLRPTTAAGFEGRSEGMLPPRCSAGCALLAPGVPCSSSSESTMSAQRTLALAGSVGAAHAGAGSEELPMASTSSSSSESSTSAHRTRGLSGGGSETEAVVEASELSSSAFASQVDRSEASLAKFSVAKFSGRTGAGAASTRVGRASKEFTPTDSEGAAATERPSTSPRALSRASSCTGPVESSALWVRNDAVDRTAEAPAFKRCTPSIPFGDTTVLNLNGDLLYFS